MFTIANNYLAWSDPRIAESGIEPLVHGVVSSAEPIQWRYTMRALLIDPESRSVENVDVEGREDIARLIGYDTLESDEVGPEGDRLFFDEECFLRGTSGRFQIDKVVPVSGKGVVVGSSADGTEFTDVHSSADHIQARLKYL